MKENKTVSEGFSDTILDSVQRKGLTEKLYLSSAKTMLRAKKERCRQLEQVQRPWDSNKFRLFKITRKIISIWEQQQAKERILSRD